MRRFSHFILSFTLIGVGIGTVQPAGASPGQETQTKKKDEFAKERIVSPKVAERLRLAAQTIRFVKRAVPEAGNQKDSIERTDGNSYKRLRVTRNTNVATRVPALADLAASDHVASRAAVIACTGGGNCNEIAMMSFQYLKGRGVNHTITRAGSEGLDHLFVLIGDLKHDKPSEIVVVDPWVTHPQPLLLTDFKFAHKDHPLQVFNVEKPSTKERGQKSRQARRTMTKALAASFKAKPNKILVAKMDPRMQERKSGEFWQNPHSSQGDIRFSYKVATVVNGETVLRPVKFTHPFAYSSTTTQERHKLLTGSAVRSQKAQEKLQRKRDSKPGKRAFRTAR